jgi:hypothetical protein
MKYVIDIIMLYMLLMHIYRRLWIDIYVEMMMMMMMLYDRADLYYNLRRRSIFTTIHMNVLCDDGHIMTHIIENDNAGGTLLLWYVYFYCHKNNWIESCYLCDGINVNNNNENVGYIRRVEIMLWSCVYRYDEVY